MRLGLRMLSILVIALSFTSTVANGDQEYALNRVASTRHGVSYSVKVLGGHAYVTGNDGVSVFDVADPSQPRLVATLEMADGAFDLTFIGTTAYIAGDEEGLVIADFSDPESPVTLGSVNDGGVAYDVDVEGGVAYLADYTSGLEVIDVSDSTAPAKLGEYPLNDARSVRVRGGVVYLGNPGSGVVMLDASIPGSLTKMGIVSGSAPVIDINLRGDYMLLSCHGSGLKVYDISDPEHPSLVGSYVEPGGEAYCVEIHEDRLYVADLQRGGLLLDFSEPSNIRKISAYGDAGPHDLVYADGYVFMACEEGLVILEYGISEASPTAWMNYILSTAVSLALVIGVLVYTKVLKR
jgi:hypothetical protein